MLHGGDSVHVWCAVLSPQLLKANELNLALIAAIPAFVVRHRVVGCTLETASHGCSTMLQAAVWAAELRGTDSGSLILGKGCGGWQHVSVLAWDAGKPSGGLLCQSWMQLLTGPGSPWVFCRSSVNPWHRRLAGWCTCCSGGSGRRPWTRSTRRCPAGDT